MLQTSSKMFKRLSKSRRHSADEIVNVLPNHQMNSVITTSRKNSDGQLQNYNLFNNSKSSKYLRKTNCTDEYSLLTTTEEDQQDDDKNQTERDYHVVTAVPAFIVEHEAEKQRGLFIFRFILLII